MESRCLLATFTVVEPGDADPATTLFRPAVNTPLDATNNPTTIAKGDFDGDGFVDLVTGNAGTGTPFHAQTLSVQLNNGFGAFLPQTGITLSTLGSSFTVPVAVADFNNDGRDDIVAAFDSSSPSTTYFYGVYLSNGDGTFTAGPSGSLANPIQSIVTADFDGVNGPDFAVASAGTITVYLNNGAGIFNPQAPVTATGVTQIAVGDFDSGTGPDIVGGGPTLSSLQIFLNNGSGGFGTPTSVPVAGGTTDNGASVGDVNNDGFADLAVDVIVDALAGTQLLAVYLGDGAGNFTPVPQGTPNPLSTVISSTGLALGDYNGDGRLDVAIESGLNSNVAVLLGNGDGTFQSPTAATTFATTNIPVAAVAGDFNKDGADDVATANVIPSPGGGNLDAFETVGTFRQALTRANSRPGADLINFNVSSTFGPFADIALSDELPNISGPVVIDGYSQPGSAPNTLPDGSNAVLGVVLRPQTLSPAAHGLTIVSTGVTVRGLAINGFIADGIQIFGPAGDSDSLSIVGNFIGTDRAGTAAVPNGIGIALRNSDITTTIGGVLPADRNVISGNTQANIDLAIGGSRVVVLGNLIGTNAAGNAGLGNAIQGIAIGVSSTTIGGTVPGARNVISGNAGVGVAIVGGGAVLLGNYIGTNATGTGAVPNVQQGVLITGPSNTIGGLGAGAGNLISGNGGNGVLVVGTGANFNLIQGNLIGADVTGTGVIPNAFSGVFAGDGASVVPPVVGASLRTTIDSNVIVGNLAYGVVIVGSNTAANTITNNLIGTNAAGASGLGNRLAGIILNNSGGNTVGGAGAGGNVISGNAQQGIIIQSASATGNVIQGNLIGVSPAGSAALPNGQDGILIGGAGGNTIGGTAPGAGNVISGNGLPLETIQSVSVQPPPLQVITGDVNRDGNPDLITLTQPASNDAPGSITVNLGDGTGGFGPSVITTITPGLFAVGFLQNFGASPAVVITSYSISTATGSIDLYPLNSDGNVLTASGVNLGTTSAAIPDSVAIGDLDGDSLDDVAWSERDTLTGNGRVIVRQNNGSSFAPGITLTSGINQPNALAYGSFGFDSTTFDEIVGLAVANGGDNTASILIANTSGGSLQFNAPITKTVGTNPSALAVADLTSDGRGDVVVANAGSNTISIILQNSDGSFGTPVSRPVGNNPSAVALADIDGDFRTDILVTNRDDNTLTVFTRGGTGSIRPPVAVPVGLTPVSLATFGFFDGDNFVTEVAVANSQGGNLSILAAPLGNTAGIRISLGTSGAPADGNVLLGNMIGLNRTGTAAIPNVGDGIRLVNASNTQIGGTTAQARNVISGNNKYGVVISGSISTGNLIQGNYIGTNAAGGGTTLGNGRAGVQILNAPRNTLGGSVAGAGNVISSNQTNGVEITGTVDTSTPTPTFSDAPGNVVQGNLIGVDAAGNADLGNFGHGVAIALATGTTIGGTTAAARNVISGNADHGIDLQGDAFNGFGASGTLVQGNYVGTNAAGTAAVRNEGEGIAFHSAPNNTIGGTAPGAGNLIAGNGDDGIALISDAPSGTFGPKQVSSGNIIQGNLIGTDVTGLAAMPNGSRFPTIVGAGIFIANSPNNTVGGPEPGARNVISGNQVRGLLISRPASTGNLVQGNFIGVGIDGVTPVANAQEGIRFHNEAANNSVIGNVIAYNGTDGVSVTQDLTLNEYNPPIGAAFNITILSNSIFNNGGLGIYINPISPAITTPPTVVLAPTDGNVVQGTVSAAPNTTVQVQVFFNNTPGTGIQVQGQSLINALSVTTGADGIGRFTANLHSPLPAGGLITATATVGAATSQFSTAFAVQAPQVLTIDNATMTLDAGGSGVLTFTVTLSASNTVPVTVQFATADGTAVAPADYTSQSGQLSFAPPSSFSPGQTSLTISVPIFGRAVDPLTKTFFVNLASPFGAVLGNTQGIGTIVVVPSAGNLIQGTNGDDVFIIGPVVAASDGVTPIQILVTLNNQPLPPIDLTTAAGRNTTVDALAGNDRFIIRLGNLAAPGFLSSIGFLALLGSGDNDAFSFDSLPNLPNLIVSLDGGGGSNRLVLGNSALGTDVYAYNEAPHANSSSSSGAPLPQRLEFAPIGVAVPAAIASFGFQNIATIDNIAINGDITLVGDYGKGRAFGAGANLSLPPAQRVGVTPGRSAADNFRVNVVGTRAVNAGLQANLTGVPLIPFRGVQGSGKVRATLLGYTQNDVFSVRLPEAFDNATVLVRVEGGSEQSPSTGAGDLLNLELANPQPGNVEVRSTNNTADVGQILSFTGIDSIAATGAVRGQNVPLDQVTFGVQDNPTVDVYLGATGTVTPTVYDPVFVDRLANGTRHIALGTAQVTNGAFLRLEGSGQTANVILDRTPAGPTRSLSVIGSGNSILKLTDPDGGAKIVSSISFNRRSGILTIRYPGQRGVTYTIAYQGIARISSQLRLAQGVRLPRALTRPARSVPTASQARLQAAKGGAGHAAARAAKPARPAAAGAHVHTAARAVPAGPHAHKG